MSENIIIEPKQVTKILVIKPSSLGDILHVFPALELLHRNYPNAKLDFMVNPVFAPILAYSPWKINKIIKFERKKLGKILTLIPETVKLTNNLRAEYYDLVIDFQGLMRSALFASITRRKALFGFSDCREKLAKYFYNYPIKIVEQDHAVLKNLQLAREITKDFAPFESSTLPKVKKFKKELELNFGKLPKKLIGIVAGGRWASKQFPPSLFAEIINSFYHKNSEYSFVAVGTADELDIANELQQKLKSKINFINAVGKTSIGSMTEILRKCDAVISNDSGPAHIAAALGKVTFSFFGPTKPEKTRPFGDNCYYFQKELSCLGCMNRNCKAFDYPLCHELNGVEIAKKLSDKIKKMEEI